MERRDNGIDFNYEEIKKVLNEAINEKMAKEMVSWNTFIWDSWVPEIVRKQIERFWSEEMGRGPIEWIKDSIEQGAPNYGEKVTLQVICGDEYRTGRYIHAWNNIGRLIHEDGSFSYVFFNRGW